MKLYRVAWVGLNLYDYHGFQLKVTPAQTYLTYTVKVIQGQPLGFDTKYLTLADRNMQVRFSLKVVWEF